VRPCGPVLFAVTRRVAKLYISQ